MPQRHKDPEYHSKYYQSNKKNHLERQRQYALRTKFGLTPEQYDELLTRQHENCAVCQRHYTTFKNRLAVDHNHKTGEIRGLLCTFCNRYFIGRHTDPDAFDRAAAYLRLGTGWFVPPKKKKRKTKRKVRK